MDVGTAYGVTGDFYRCNGFASCLDIITYKDDVGTVITFDKDDTDSILVQGDPFAVNDNVQHVESAGGVAHPVLAWKQDDFCIRMIGTRGIAVAFCGWEMYVWAEDGILGALEGLCLAGPEFDADEPSSGYRRLDATQGEINQWGESLRVSGNSTSSPLETTTALPVVGFCENVNEIWTDCETLFNFSDTSASGSLLQVTVEFCVVDLCAMTLSGATHAEMEDWKGVMVIMLIYTIEIINRTHHIPPETTTAPHTTTVGHTTTTPHTTTDTQECEFNGETYSSGDSLEGSCLILICREGTWRATGEISGTCSRCSIRNDPHFIDFSGLAFDFHGTASYKIAMDVGTAYGVTGGFYRCNGFASCLDIITYKDDVGTVITFDKDDTDSILVQGHPFAVNNNVQHVESAGGVAHPVLAWKHDARCIRMIGTRGIAVAFCRHQMYVWAENGILGALEGLCLAGPEFDADEPSSGLRRLDATQREINQWGESLRLSGFPDLRVDIITPIQCDNTTDEKLHEECTELLEGASYNDNRPSSALLKIAIHFCAVDLCAMTLSGATHAEMEDWKEVMVVMLINTIEIIVRTHPKDDPPPPSEDSTDRSEADSRGGINIQVLQEVNL